MSNQQQSTALFWRKYSFTVECIHHHHHLQAADAEFRWNICLVRNPKKLFSVHFDCKDDFSSGRDDFTRYPMNEIQLKNIEKYN